MIRQMKTAEGNELRMESDYVDGIGVLGIGAKKPAIDKFLPV